MGAVGSGADDRRGPEPTAPIQGVEPSCGLHSTCTWPRNDTRYPIVLNAWRPTVVFRAQAGTGMGTISMILKLGGPVRTGTTVSFLVRPS